MDFWIRSALTLPNTYFVFRETGAEVRVGVIGGTIFTSHKLTKEEIEFFNENILRTK